MEAKAHLLVRVMDPKGYVSSLAVPITRALQDAIATGDAALRGGFSEVVVNMPIEGVLLDDDVVEQLADQHCYPQWGLQRGLSDPDGKCDVGPLGTMIVPSAMVTATGPVTNWGHANPLTLRVREDGIQVGVSTRHWDTTTFELGAEPCRDDALQGGWWSRGGEVPLLLEWVAQYAPSPPAAPTVLDLWLWETSDDVVKVPEYASLAATPEFVSAVESAHRALTSLRAAGTPAESIALNGRSWFDFGRAALETQVVDWNTDDNGERWVACDVVILDVFPDAFQFVGEESDGGGAVKSERVEFSKVPELAHLAPSSAPAPGM